MTSETSYIPKKKFNPGPGSRSETRAGQVLHQHQLLLRGHGQGAVSAGAGGDSKGSEGRGPRGGGSRDRVCPGGGCE